MWQAGLEAEVRGLAAQGLREGRTASRALGYQQLLRYLDGEWTLDEARLETIKATRRFARRQESWFRRDPRVSWLDASSREPCSPKPSASPAPHDHYEGFTPARPRGYI